VARHLRIVSSEPSRPPRRPRWQTELAKAITTVSELAAVVNLTEDERQGAERARDAGLPLRITRSYAKLMDPEDPTCPIRLQCVPSAAEGVQHPHDLVDPLGEEANEAAPHLVQRYPDRALLLVTDQCALYCRFCTRSRMVGDGKGPVPERSLEPAFEYLAGHREVRDVIVSGGDPLAMVTPRIVRILARLRAIPSIETIRLATRVPVTLPSRITRELVVALRPFHPIWIMTHFNHPKELTADARRAVVRLADAGFPVMNQTVLMRGVNDSAETLAELFRGLVRVRARPYYLLQMDPVMGTSHLRTPLETGVAIMEQLQGRLTGIALPKLIVDTPGGFGKVPHGPRWVVGEGDGWTAFRTHRAAEVRYYDPR
jgi:lysine 2,3-aminomutase